MVMVGNKRSKTQMENDLQLFLGANTVPFTSWLYQVLQKLQEVTVASKSEYFISFCRYYFFCSIFKILVI